MSKASSPKARPDRFTRIVILVWVVAGVLIVTTAIRVLLAIGVFSFVSPVMQGVCRAISLPGPGDLAYDEKSRTLFIAARDGVYAMPDGAAKPLKTNVPTAGFTPTAIAMGYDLGGAPALQVMSRGRTGVMAIEGYSVTPDGANAPHLASQNMVQGGLIARAQGITSLGNGRLYVAADLAKSDLMAWADRYLPVARAHILFFNGMMFRPAIEGLGDPSGVAVTPDGGHLFVASRNERRLLSFTVEPMSGNLTENSSIALPMRPERVSVDAQGALWVAGAPRLPAIAGGAHAPSQVVRVVVDSAGKPQSQETIFADGGGQIGAASAAVHAQGHLFIGSALDNKLLDCPYK